MRGVIFDSFWGRLRTRGKYFRRLQAAGVAAVRIQPGKACGGGHCSARCTCAITASCLIVDGRIAFVAASNFSSGVRVRFGGHAHHR